MKSCDKLRLKSVLKTLLLKEKFYQSIHLFSVSFLVWLVSTYICQAYFFANLSVLWVLCSALAILSLTRYLQSKILPKRDLVTTIETQLIKSKVLTENDRGILSVLVDDLGRDSNLLPSTQKVYNSSIVALMYTRIAHHSEIIKRQQPKFPQEILVCVLAVAFFLGPNVVAQIDFTLDFNWPIVTHSKPKEGVNLKKINTIQKPENTNLPKAKLNRNKSLNQPLQHTTEIRLQQEEYTSLNQKNDSQSNHKQTQGSLNPSIKTRQMSQDKVLKSTVMMGQVGGRTSGQSITFDQDVRERQRLVEVFKVSADLKQMTPKQKSVPKENKDVNIKEQSTARRNKVHGQSEYSTTLKRSPTLSNSRRQALRNEAYLLGSTNQEKRQDFPPALRMLIPRK